MVDMRYGVLLVAAACGRIGFSPLGGGDGGVTGFDGRVPANAIVVSVTTDSSNATPVAGATVLVDRGTGSLEPQLTDASGTAEISAASATTFHVVYAAGASAWRVYTVIAAPPGSLVALGGRHSASAAMSSMTWTVPSLGPGFSYLPLIPNACGTEPQFVGATMTIAYSTACEGETFHAYVLATAPPAIEVLDGGELTLTANNVQAFPGAFGTPGNYVVNIANVPTGSIALSATLETTGSDAMPLSYLTPVTSPGASTSMTVAAPPGGTALLLGGTGPASGPYTSDTGALVAATGSSTNIDGSQLPPVLSTLTLSPSASSASWALAGNTSATPSIMWFDATIMTAVAIQWTAYGPAQTASVQFPPLPADLAAANPENGTWNVVSVYLYVAAASYAELLATIDADPSSMELPSVIGQENSWINYQSALGPP